MQRRRAFVSRSRAAVEADRRDCFAAWERISFAVFLVAGQRAHWAINGESSRLSGQLARGPSVLPELHPQFPAIALEQFERPLGPLSADVLRPLDRFYEAHAISKRYALGQPGGSLVDSVRRLAFTFPMSLWMLRWLAHDREPTADDMVQIVVALERAVVLPALNGATRYLSGSGQLERLIAWYSR